MGKQSKEDFLEIWLAIFYSAWEKEAGEIEKREAYQAYLQIRKLIEIWYKYNLWNLHTVTSTIGEQEGINENKEKP